MRLDFTHLSRRGFLEFRNRSKTIFPMALMPATYPPTLEELIQIELEFWWKKSRSAESTIGDNQFDTKPPLVENYLQRFAAINQPAIVIRLLQQEYHVRNSFGDRPLIEEYCQRFPELLPDIPGAKSILQSTEDSTSPQSRGRYRLIDRHARGGFGEVWRAEDPVLQREVAVKQLTNRVARQSEVRQRFINEAQTTARLEHPGVVPVYDLIDSEGESPSYAMRFLSGHTLAEAIQLYHQKRSKSTENSVASLRLLNAFLNVVRTLQFAHSRNIIHRDLKPQNVMLGDYGETIVVDWGLAKNLALTGPDGEKIDAPSAGSHTETIAGSVMGTPAYMSPEQFAGNNDQVDQTSDVYSLGAILYEVLTGQPPHGVVDFDNKSRSQPASPRGLVSEVPVPLAAICMKALSVDRSERYSTAAELTKDVELYLADEPVSAHPDTIVAKVGRWLRRHRTFTIAAVAITSVVFVALAAVLAVVVDAKEKVEERNQALVVEKRKTEEALDEAEANLYFQRIVSAYHELIDNHNATQATATLDLCPQERRKWEWHFVRNLAMRDKHTQFAGHKGRVQQAAFNSDETLIATADDSGEFRIWDAKTGKQLLGGQHEGGASSIVFSPDDKTIITAGLDSHRKGGIKFWDASTLKLKKELVAHDSLVFDLAFSPNGNYLATCSKDETIKIWDSAMKLVKTLEGHTNDVTALAFNHDGTRLVSGSKDRSVRVWNVETGLLYYRFRGHGGIVRDVAFRPDGEYVASASEDKTVRTWDVEDKQPRHVLVGHKDEVYGVAYAHDNTTLASAGFDSAIHVWNSRSAKIEYTLRGHNSHVRRVQFSKDDSKILSAADDKSAHLWQLTRNEVDPQFPGMQICFHPQGKLFATTVALSTRQYEVRIFDIETQKQLRKIAYAGRINDVQFNREGSKFAFCSADGKVVVCNTADAKQTRELDGTNIQMRLAFSPDDTLLAVGDLQGIIRIWNMNNENPPSEIRAHGDGVAGIEFSPDGKTLASAGMDMIAKLWTVKDGKEIRILKGHTAKLTHITFSPDGKELATSSFDGTIRTWDVETGAPKKELVAGKFYLNSVAYSPDGTRIASGSDQLLKIWEAKSGKQVFSRWGHNCINELVFSPNGKWLGIAGSHKNVRLWQGK
jgi:WD40 repeat protein/tRNA A-37 threonylcarbamoyl transferase component Bud32